MPLADQPLSARSASKRSAILAAAERAFLTHGYLGTSMDGVAADSRVSKQTIYAHFGTKEQLFVDLVKAMTDEAGDAVEVLTPRLDSPEQFRTWLRDYSRGQLDAVLTPRLMRLRRLVIAEVPRFPELAAVMQAQGAGRVIEHLTQVCAEAAVRGLIEADPARAARRLNWLLMAEPINAVMMLGDDALPSPDAREAIANQAVHDFLRLFAAPRV